MSRYLEFRDRFAEAMDRRLYTPEWLDERVASGSALLWAGNASAILAELRHYPTGARAIHGLYATGDTREIVSSLIPQAEEWGRLAGCGTAFVNSREAWRRLLSPSGYEPYKVELRKDL